MYKNQLQEFCQKHHNPIPVYETNKINDRFISKLTIKYQNNIYSETGDSTLSKKSAEMNAAQKLLNNLELIISSYTINYISDNAITVLIDMENIHMGNFFLHKRFNSNFNFIGFATNNHPSIGVAPSEINTIKTIASDRKDACDILIIGYSSREIDKMGDIIIILTKDHFGPGLVDYLISISNKNIICLKTIESLEEYFSQYIVKQNLSEIIKI